MSFDRNIAPLSLVSSGLTGQVGKAFLSIPAIAYPLIGYGKNINDGVADINLPSILSYGVNNKPLELQSLSTEATGLTGTISRADLPFPELQALITAGRGLTNNVAIGALTLPKLLVSGKSGSFANISLKPVAIVAIGQGGQDGLAVLFTQALSLVARGTNANLATGSPQLKALTLSANVLNGTKAIANKEIPRLTLVGQGLTGTVNQPQVIILPVITIDATGAAQSIGSASISLPALQLAAAALDSIIAAYDANSTCYVMNTNTNAMTEYTNFGFNSFANFNGKVIAANASGIFELLGSNDNGASIPIETMTGEMDFGSEQLKRLNELYAGYRSDGDLNIQVIVDGNESYNYILETQGKTGIYTNRVKLGKGMKGRYYQIKIDGSAVNVELDSLTADPVVLTRKLA